MPGIVGIVSREAPAVCREQLAAMLKSMRHEPHYRCGTCEAPELGVYAGWVAHPGSFAALHSGSGQDRETDLALAGECVGESADSLRELYDRLGENWVVELNGLFSGLLIDRDRGRALLFNDRFGMERIYVHQTADATYFASEAKALLRVLPATRSFDDQGVAQFLTFGCPIEGRTLFQGIHLLDGASVWTLERGACHKRTYFTPSEWERQSTLSVNEYQSEFQTTFKRALPRYLASDSRIGISLTGGLDTRMIMACLPPLEPSPVCYTFAGLTGEPLDVRIASRVAAECGLEHRTLRIRPDFLTDFASYVDRTVYATDGCAGAGAAHEIYLNAQVRQLAPVRLTGNFGSEVLRSMSTFKRAPVSRELVSTEFHAHLDGVTQEHHTERSAVTFAAFREIPWSLFGVMASAKSQVTFRTPYLDNDLVALAYRAPASVRCSPTSALDLVAEAQPRLGRIATDRAVVAGGRGVGYALRRIGEELSFKLDYMHKEAPPSGLRALFDVLDKTPVLGRHKWLPYRLWFRNELAGYIGDALNDSSTLRLPFLNHRFLPTMARDHNSGRHNHVREIYATLTLAAVDRLLVRGDGWQLNRRSAFAGDQQ